MKHLLSLVSLALLAPSAPAMAQPVPCELHVWPSRPATSTGPNGLLTPSTQAIAAASIDMVSLFGMNPGMVVFESDRLDMHSAPRNPHRLLDSAPDCHAELIITNDVEKSSLKTGFTFRDFRSGTLRIASGNVASQVNAGANETRAVSDAFVANIKTIARQVQAQKR